MKAMVWTAYGGPHVLQLREVEKPVPKDNEVLIKIHAATVTQGDCEMRSLKFPLWMLLLVRLYAGWMRPKRITVLGQELAGEIEVAGKDVTAFNVGDRVFGRTGFNMGAYAQYLTLPESGEGGGVISVIPGGMSYEQAAALPLGGLESLHFLRAARLKPGDRVLINGAGGSIGTAGIQLAKFYGAEVTAVDHTEKLGILRDLGADYTVDYTQEDFTRSGDCYDVIFDVIGKSPFWRSLDCLSENGRYLLANPHSCQRLISSFAVRRSGKAIYHQTASPTRKDLELLRDLVDAGKLRTVIDRTYPLDELVEAHRHVESGRKQGNVVIQVAHP